MNCTFWFGETYEIYNNWSNWACCMFSSFITSSCVDSLALWSMLVWYADHINSLRNSGCQPGVVLSNRNPLHSGTLSDLHSGDVCRKHASLAEIWGVPKCKVQYLCFVIGHQAGISCSQECFGYNAFHNHIKEKTVTYSIVLLNEMLLHANLLNCLTIKNIIE